MALSFKKTVSKTITFVHVSTKGKKDYNQGCLEMSALSLGYNIFFLNH